VVHQQPDQGYGSAQAPCAAEGYWPHHNQLHTICCRDNELIEVLLCAIQSVLTMLLLLSLRPEPFPKMAAILCQGDDIAERNAQGHGQIHAWIAVYDQHPVAIPSQQPGQ